MELNNKPTAYLKNIRIEEKTYFKNIEKTSAAFSYGSFVSSNEPPNFLFIKKSAKLDPRFWH